MRGRDRTEKRQRRKMGGVGGGRKSYGIGKDWGKESEQEVDRSRTRQLKMLLRSVLQPFDLETISPVASHLHSKSALCCCFAFPYQLCCYGCQGKRTLIITFHDLTKK